MNATKVNINATANTIVNVQYSASRLEIHVLGVSITYRSAEGIGWKKQKHFADLINGVCGFDQQSHKPIPKLIKVATEMLLSAF